MVQFFFKFAMSWGRKGTAIRRRSSFGHTGRKDCVDPSSLFHRKQNGVEKKHDANMVHFDTLIHRFLSGINCSSSLWFIRASM